MRPQRDAAVLAPLGDERSAPQRLPELRERIRADGAGSRIPEQLEEEREGRRQAQPQRVRLGRLDGVDDPAEEELTSLRTVGELTRDGLGVNGLAGRGAGCGVEEGVRPQLHDQIEGTRLLDALGEVAVDRTAARIDGDQSRMAQHRRRCRLAYHSPPHDAALAVRHGLARREQRRSRGRSEDGRRRHGRARRGRLAAALAAAGLAAFGSRRLRARRRPPRPRRRCRRRAADRRPRPRRRAARRDGCAWGRRVDRGCPCGAVRSARLSRRVAQRYPARQMVRGTGPPSRPGEASPTRCRAASAPLRRPSSSGPMGDPRPGSPRRPRRRPSA